MYMQIEASFLYPETADKIYGDIKRSGIKLVGFTHGNSVKYNRMRRNRSFLSEFSGYNDIESAFEDSSMSYHILPAVYPLDRKIRLLCNENDVYKIRKILNGNGAYDVKQTRL